MTPYFRPIAHTDPVRPPGALPLAGGWAWFDRAERITREGAREIVAAEAIPADLRDRLSAPRAVLAGLSFDAPRLMGILNVTPDSFSDGGRDADAAAAAARAEALVAAGADILDIGGESTRPGAAEVPAETERSRVLPVIAALKPRVTAPLSLDTRKAAVAGPALDAGVDIVNDVSSFTHDPDLGPLCATRGVPVCAMHMIGTPETMQHNPRYDDVVLDVYDALEARVQALEAMGFDRARIIVDPGIGFGKTEAHNLALLRSLSLFHGLGCVMLLGVSRKGFIGRIGQAPEADRRAPGSIAIGLAALDQGVQILRVHDVAETRQALRLWAAVRMSRGEGA